MFSTFSLQIFQLKIFASFIQIGKAKVVHKSDSDAVLVIAAGITLDQAFKAAAKLKSEHGVDIRILDPFTIKPIDKDAIIANAKECGGRIITVEDHYSEVRMLAEIKFLL